VRDVVYEVMVTCSLSKGSFRVSTSSPPSSFSVTTPLLSFLRIPVPQVRASVGIAPIYSNGRLRLVSGHASMCVQVVHSVAGHVVEKFHLMS